MPKATGRLKVYRVNSAAKALGISTRQLRRLTQMLGKKPGNMGSNYVYLYSDADLAAIQKLRAAS